MLLTCLLAATLAAEPVSAAPPALSLALPGLNAVNLEKGEAELHAEVLAQALQRRGVKVMTARDLAAVLGVERQKELLGCNDTTCVAELVGGLGADGVIVGDVGHLGTEYAINVKVLAAKDSRVLAMFNLRAPEAALVPRALEICAWEVLGQMGPALGRPALVPTDRRPSLTPPPSPKWWAVAPAAVAVAGLAVGVVAQGSAQAKFDAMGTATSVDELTTLRTDGAGSQTWARVGFGVAAAGLLGTAAVLAFAPAAEGPRPSAWLVPGGGGVVLTGVLP